MKKMTLITFFEDIWQTPNLKLRPPGQYVGDPWKKISWMRPRKPFLEKKLFNWVSDKKNFKSKTGLKWSKTHKKNTNIFFFKLTCLIKKILGLKQVLNDPKLTNKKLKKVFFKKAASIYLGGRTPFDFLNVHVKSFPKWYDTCILDENWGL